MSHRQSFHPCGTSKQLIRIDTRSAQIDPKLHLLHCKHQKTCVEPKSA